MNPEIIARAAALIDNDESFALATVVRREAPSSARTGDAAIVTNDGKLFGFIGGRCTQETIVEQALAALADGAARLISFRDEAPRADDLISVPMTCHSGGSVEIHINPVIPAPTLLIVGTSPVSAALQRLGAAMGYRVDAVDSLDGVDESRASGGALERARGRAEGVKLFALVATMGESDEDALLDLLGARPDYLGVIASRRRMEQVRATLQAKGADPGAISEIHGPAGLDLGGNLPEEVALSILAQIVMQQRHGGQGSISPDEASSAEASAPVAKTSPIDVDERAIDPVCGMSIVADVSRPRAVHEEITYYFCCSGCRDQFLGNPDSYVAALGPSSDTRSER